jgi:TrmH family RNA methyltransferase
LHENLEEMISKNRIKFIHSLTQRKYRKESGLFVAEGHKLVGELLPILECTYLAATEEWINENKAIIKSLMSGGLEVDVLTSEELLRTSLQKSPQDVLALFKQPVYHEDATEIISSKLCLGLDGIQDPGNIGTIVRIADWFGIEDIFCSKDTVDIFNPKAIQATMGAIARVKVKYIDFNTLLPTISNSTPIYGTFLDGENIYNEELSNKGLIIMGNEGNGISETVSHFVNKRLYIPNYPQERFTTESLNVAVATAITCAEFRRRLKD